MVPLLKALRYDQLDKLGFVLVIFLFAFVSPDILIMVVYFLLVPYLILTRRTGAVYHLLLSSALALTWMFFAKDQYGYNQDIYTLWGINLFAFFAWATGLFGVYLLFSHWESKHPRENPVHKLGLFLVLYWSILILMETLFYHVYNLQNLASTGYAGLPICQCLHAPPWMQVSYFLLGPVYFLLCKMLGVKYQAEKIQ